MRPAPDCILPAQASRAGTWDGERGEKWEAPWALGRAVWLSAEFSGPPGLCGGGAGQGSQAGRGCAAAAVVRLSEQLSLELAWGLSGLSCLGAGVGEALPHREEAGVPGCVKPPPWRDHAGAEVWHVARTQERSLVSAALNLCS